MSIPKYLAELVNDANTIDSLPFRDRLVARRKATEAGDNLVSCLMNAGNNLANYGYIPQYKSQYEAEIRQLRSQLNTLIEAYPFLSYLLDTPYLPK